jgi:hypothetical protein
MRRNAEPARGKMLIIQSRMLEVSSVWKWTCALLVGCSGEDAPAQGPPRLAPNEALPSLTLGEPITLLGDGALGLSYFPDEGTSVLESASGIRLVLTARTSTYLVEGTDLQQLSAARPIVLPGGAGEFDNGYAGVSATVLVGGVYYGFYHAEDQEDLPNLGGGIPGYYASIAVATSEDDGLTWTKRGQVITSAQPKSWTAYPNQGDRGAAEPGAVLSEDGRFVYLYYTEHSRVNGRSVDICVARADLHAGPPLPGSFMKYRNGAFSEPGLGGADSPIVIGPAPAVANALQGHVTFSQRVQRYLMIFGVDAWQERMAGQAPQMSGLYSAWSADGITWSTPAQLFADQGVPELSRSLSWQGSVIWDDDSGAAGMLVYGYTPSWGTTPHYMVGRRVTIVDKAPARP